MGNVNPEFYMQNMEGSVCCVSKFEESMTDHPILPDRSGWIQHGLVLQQGIC